VFDENALKLKSMVKDFTDFTEKQRLQDLLKKMGGERRIFHFKVISLVLTIFLIFFTSKYFQ
jgi:hypothetical protein